MMRLILAAFVMGCAAMTGAGMALADDTTTTTTTTTTNPPPAPGVTVGVPGVVGVTIGGGAPAQGCATRSTTQTDNDTGQSVSRTTTDCN